MAVVILHVYKIWKEFFEALLRLSKPPVCLKYTSAWIKKAHKIVLIHKNLISNTFCKNVLLVYHILDVNIIVPWFRPASRRVLSGHFVVVLSLGVFTAVWLKTPVFNGTWLSIVSLFIKSHSKVFLAVSGKTSTSLPDRYFAVHRTS